MASADDVVQLVESLLASSQGRAQITRFNCLVTNIVGSLPGLGELRKRLRQRADMQLYINASTAQDVATRSKVALSVRVRGIECGKVEVGVAGNRRFQPTNARLF